MTNSEIILKAVIENKIYTKEQAKEILEGGHDIPVHTYAAWKKLGFQVKKGEKASIKIKLWRAIKKKDEKAKKDELQFILVNTSLFTEEQVKKL